MEYNVLNFGAVGDGLTDDTAAIQSAIDLCRDSGGGTVIISAGRTFRCGLLDLCSNLELRLGPGAVLRGSDDISDYSPRGGPAGSRELRGVPSFENCDYTGAPNHFFIRAKDCDNIAITGFGSIDGNEAAFFGEVTRWHIEGAFYPRAPMIFFENCSRVTLRDVTLTRSAFWTVHLVGCRDVLIDGIRILNDLRMANCDGIDPDHCRNVRIANCHIECADDCIVLKNSAAASKYGPCEDITVTNCTLTSTSAAIKFGSESVDDFRRVLVENCAISRTNRGISIQLRDGGSVEDVSFRNISIDTRLFHPEMYWGDAEPIAITVLPRRAGGHVGSVRRVSFSGLMCSCENGVLLWSEAPGGISDIDFDGLSLRLRRATDRKPGRHDLRPRDGREGPMDSLNYVRAHNVHGCAFRHCRFTASEDISSLMDAPVLATDCEDMEV